MPNRVYIHIGLPKTATTSLQFDYFPYVNHKKYCYLGVHQPRPEKISDSLFDQVISSARSGLGISHSNQALKERLSKEQKSLILSEEMLTVSGITLSWQEQLSNLACILEGIDCKLLLTVREPVSAMFSYYLEGYEHFQEKGYEFTKLARDDNEFKIYHYDYLLSELAKYYDPGRIHIQTFEDLTKSDLSQVNDFLDQPAMESGFRKLSNQNKKRKTGSAVLVPKKFKLRWITITYQLIGGDNSRFARALKKIAHKPIQKVRGIGRVAVPDLSNEDRLELTEEMAQTMENMSERFGVRY